MSASIGTPMTRFETATPQRIADRIEEIAMTASHFLRQERLGFWLRNSIPVARRISAKRIRKSARYQPLNIVA